MFGCAHAPPDTSERARTASEIAASVNWQQLWLDAPRFPLAAYASPVEAADGDELTVYIEGDGLAWLGPSSVSPDPTPLRPLALELAVQHQQSAAAWLARPCQYVQGKERHNCSSEWWTGARFAEEVVAASNDAIDQLKRRAGAKRVALVGYSGGGAIAVLVAARRDDVVHLTTVAGNLDHRLWTQWHALTPLDQSLNPVDVADLVAHIPQVHFTGGKDRIVGRRLADAFVSRMPNATDAAVRVVPQADHRCCWATLWRSLRP